MSATKICSKCKVEKPANTDYFGKHKKHGFQSWCKECKRENHLQNREERIKRSKENYRRNHPKEHSVALPPGMKLCKSCNELKRASTEYFGLLKESKDGFKYTCKSCRSNHEYYSQADEIKAKRKGYYSKNKIKVAAAIKRYRIKHNEWYKEYNKSYYTENASLIKKRVNNYYHENKDKIAPKQKVYRRKWNSSDHGRKLKRYYQEKRRSMKANLLDTLSMDQWHECLEYFHNQCAYCGEHSENFHQEHVVPLSKGGHYTKQNIVPSCQKCNNSKWAHDMEDWFKKQEFFSERKLRKIHQWTNAIENTQQIAFF